MRMKSRVVERGPAETEVTVTSDVNVVGVLAQFGRGMIQDVSDQLFRKFTEAMRRQLETGTGEAEAPAAPRAAGEETVGREATMRAVAEKAVVPATAAAPATTSLPVASRTGAATTESPAAGTPSPATPSAATPPPTTPSAAPPPPPPPPASAENVLDVGALGTAALGRAAMRTLRRPGFWITVVALALIVYWWASR